MQWKKTRLWFVCLSAIFFAGCSTLQDNGERQDPFESFNRTMWKFNYEVLDPYVLKPIATVWQEYIPSPIKTGLVNVANNLDEPTSFVNRLLEGNIPQAMTHFHRFVINSTWGLGGLIDWASYSQPLQITGPRRFGDVLGYYGVGTGPYVMLPAYGPATIRQDVAGLVDYTYPALSLLGPWGLVKSGIQGIDRRAKVLSQEGLLKQAQDPYVIFREAYFQNLRFRVNNGKGEDNTPNALDSDDLKSID